MQDEQVYINTNGLTNAYVRRPALAPIRASVVGDYQSTCLLNKLTDVLYQRQSLQ